MSEYWKSTPKYWCKNCSTYIRDTAFERRQHESTAKHQNNLKRFLRDIQNDHERTERDKQKAKAEVERLNRITGSGTGAARPATTSTAPTIHKSTSGVLTAGDQKRQWTQLAEMGIQVPDTLRGEMAMAGNWTTTSKPHPKEVAEEESLSLGIRKRKLDEGDDGDGEAQFVTHSGRKVWGKSTKNYPGRDNADLDALLSSAVPLKKEKTNTKEEKPNLSPLEKVSDIKPGVTNMTDSDTKGDAEHVANVSEGAKAVAEEAAYEVDTLVKTESADQEGETVINSTVAIPVFKKRKAKAPSVAN